MYIRGRVLSSLILGLSLILVGCSSNPEVEDKKETLTGECSQEEISGGSAWITGQLNAFSNSDAKAAYAFASEQFRSGVSLDEFASIIAGQYSALLNLETFEIINCVPIEMGFVFQVVVVQVLVLLMLMLLMLILLIMIFLVMVILVVV